MDYELAKELKEAGFPHYWLEHINGDLVEKQNFPTLSELIEACGNEFYRFDREYDSYTYETFAWHATSRDRFIDVEGKTPEEAVARLWLALNKK